MRLYPYLAARFQRLLALLRACPQSVLCGVKSLELQVFRQRVLAML